MPAQLARTVQLPLLPFQNREFECQEITSFLLDATRSSSVLVVEGEAGIGKSTLLSTVLARLGENHLTMHLNLHQTNRPLFDQITEACHRLRSPFSLRLFLRRSRFLLKKAPAVGLSLLPKLAKGFPFIGDALESALDSFLRHLRRTSDASSLGLQIERAALDLSLLSLERRLILVIDDLHTLTDQELQTLADLITLRLEDDSSTTRLIIGTRPIAATITDYFKRFLYNLASASRLSILSLQPLDRKDMEQIAVSLLHNPDASQPLLDLSRGNPQRFLGILIRLNLLGKLRTQGRLLLLPEDAATVKDIADEIWHILRRDPVLEQLVAILAVGSGQIPENRIELLHNILRTNRRGELDNAIRTLRRERILEWYPTASKSPPRYVLRFVHDTLREQVLSAIRRESEYDFRRLNHLAAEFTLAGLGERNRDIETLAKSLLDLTKEVPSRLLLYLDELTQLAANRMHSGAPGWQHLSFGVIRICEQASRYSDLIRLAGPLVEAEHSLLRPDSSHRSYLLRVLPKAHYHLGQYDDCVESASTSTKDGEILYYYSISHLISKRWGDSYAVAREASSLAATPTACRKEFLPLIKTVEALALQEGGEVEIAEQLFLEFYETEREKANRDRQWYQFQIISALFLDPRTALQLCREAFAYFRRRGDDRSCGMALHNQGWCFLETQDYGVAAGLFDEARRYLDRGWPQETVFPLNDLALVSIIGEDFSSARDYLNSCRFRRLSPYYEKAVLTNLAYAQWGLGLDNSLEILGQIKNVPGLMIDDWSQWQLEYARAFFILQPRRGSATQLDLKGCRDNLNRLRYSAAVAPFWNALVEQVCRSTGLEPSLLDEGKSSSWTNEGICSPSVSLMRPAGLCFGHV